MAIARRWSRWLATGLVASTLVVGAPPQVSAQPDANTADPGNTGRLTLNMGVDWVSEYFFRGIAQQVGGANFQPYGSVAFKLIDNAGPLTALTATPGLWNNWHAGGGNLVEPVDPEFWYEADLYFTLAAILVETVTLGLTYTAYTSPNDAFGTVQELALVLTVNDSQWLGAFALNPSLLVAGELTGQADAGHARGVYVQLSMSPSYTFAPKNIPLLTLSFPVTLGLSASNYYEFATGDNPAFGYVQFGPAVAVPLGFIPRRFGTWVVKGALELLVLGDTLEALNDNEAVKPTGRIGVSVVY